MQELGILGHGFHGVYGAFPLFYGKNRAGRVTSAVHHMQCGASVHVQKKILASDFAGTIESVHFGGLIMKLNHRAHSTCSVLREEHGENLLYKLWELDRGKM